MHCDIWQFHALSTNDLVTHSNTTKIYNLTLQKPTHNFVTHSDTLLDIFKHYRYAWEDNLQLHALSRNTHVEFSDIFSHDGCLRQWPWSPECEITNCQLFIDMHTNCHPREQAWDDVITTTPPQQEVSVKCGHWAVLPVSHFMAIQTSRGYNDCNQPSATCHSPYTHDQTVSFIPHNYDAVALHVLLLRSTRSCHVSPDAAARPSNVGRLVLCPQQLTFTHQSIVLYLVKHLISASQTSEFTPVMQASLLLYPTDLLVFARLFADHFLWRANVELRCAKAWFWSQCIHNLIYTTGCISCTSYSHTNEASWKNQTRTSALWSISHLLSIFIAYTSSVSLSLTTATCGQRMDIGQTCTTRLMNEHPAAQMSTQLLRWYWNDANPHKK